MHSLQILWWTFFDICRLRVRPQDLPASSVLLNLTLFFYALTSAVSSLLQQFSLKQAILSGIVDAGLLVGLTYTLLYFARYLPRVTQTLTALAGTNGVLGILSLPLIFWLEQNRAYHSDITLPVLLLLSLFVWNFIVYAHILRHALTVHFFIGLLLTTVTYSITVKILTQLFPLAP